MSTIYGKFFLLHKKAMLFVLSLSLSLSMVAQTRDELIDTTKKLIDIIDSTAAATDDVEMKEMAEEEVTLDPAQTVEKKPAIYFNAKSWSAEKDPLDSVRKLGDSTLAEWKNDDAFWYADLTFKRKERKPERSNSISGHPIFQTILWLVIILGFAAFLVIYLSNSNAGIFRRSKGISVEKEEEETEDIFAINYTREIDKAVAAGNHRLGVRLLFLRQLRSLSDKKMIDYKSDRTNLDYLLQLEPTKWYGDFFRLTRNYEYSWYGLFEIDKEKFGRIKKEFDEFNDKLN